MNIRRPLPDGVAGRPFTTAEALAEGVSPNRLRAQDLAVPFHGVRTTGGIESIEELAHALQARLRPDQFFSHETAAVLHGLALPRALEEERLLHVSAILPARPPRMEGVVGHRLSSEAARTMRLRDLHVAAPASTWAQLGARLGVVDLVVIADQLLGGTRPMCTVHELQDALDTCRRTGAGDLRAALPLVRRGSESPQETRTRLVIVQAGLPEPELNVDVVDALGRFVARPDMSYRRQRLAIEYEGRHHFFDHGQYEYDIERVHRLESIHWSVIRVTAELLHRRPRDLVARIRSALLARG